MGAVDEGDLRFLERLGGGDIGEDHAFLDQPVGIETLGHQHLIDHALCIEDDLALRQVQRQRLALVAGAREAAIAIPERLENGFQDRPGHVIGASVDRGLGLLIGQAGRRAHHDAVEGMALL